MEENLNTVTTAAPVSDTPERPLEELLREAEEAGYRRGRDEAVKLNLDRWECATDLAPDLLTRPRKSFWD